MELVPSDLLTVWADRSGITVTTGMMRHADRDDDLALVLAHEMAHKTVNDTALAGRWTGLSPGARAGLERRADGTLILGHGRNPLIDREERLRCLPGVVPHRSVRTRTPGDGDMTRRMGPLEPWRQV